MPCLKGICVDRFFKKHTLIKWAIFLIYFAVTSYLVRDWNMRQIQSFETGGIVLETNFHINCAVFAGLPLITYMMRIPVFILYALLTCFCDKGHKLEKETFPFSQLILSFDYITKREEELKQYADRLQVA